MYHMSVPVVVLALAACASASTGGGDVPYETQEVHTKDYNNGINGATGSVTAIETKDVMKATILAPVDSVWSVLGSVFLELGVEPQTIDPVQHYLANTSFRVQGTLGGVSVSQYLDCGTNISGNVAQLSQISMSLTVQVVRDSVSVSQLKSQVDGYAVQRGLQAQKVHCASTGRLESRIARMVTDELKHRSKT
jgi:hypothetical protein